MRTTRLIRCGLVLAVTAPLYAHAAPPLGARPGAWETTTTSSGNTVTLPQGQGRMTPEQRAMVENLMKQEQARRHVTHTMGCLKETDTLDKLIADEDGNRRCKTTVNSQTSNSLDMTMVCAPPNARRAHVKVKALSPERVSFVMDVETEDGLKVHGQGQSHWVKSSCAGINQQ